MWIRQPSSPTGKRRARQLSAAIYLIAFAGIFGSIPPATAAQPAFEPIDPDFDCRAPAEHPICAIKTFVECRRSVVNDGCDAVGLTQDEATKAWITEQNPWPRENPWLYTFSEVQGEGYDYIYFGQRVVGADRFEGATLPDTLSDFPVTEVRIKGCGIAAYECTNEAWSYFLIRNEDGQWRVTGTSEWRDGKPLRSCKPGEDPFIDRTYCGHYVFGLEE